MNRHDGLIFLVPTIPAVGGIVLLVVSNVIYARRTQDPELRTRFWLPKARLTPREYILNRLGFALAVATLPLLALVGVLLASMRP